MRKLAGVLLLVLVVAVLAPMSSRRLFAGEVYGEPELVMKAFCDRVAKGDFEGALTLFDSDLRADGFDFSYMVSRMRTISPVMMGPSEHPEFAALNRILEKNRNVQKLRFMLFSLLLPSQYSAVSEGKMLAMDGDSPEEVIRQAKEFSGYLDPTRLTGFSFRRMDFADPDKQLVQVANGSLARQLRAFAGCQDIRDYAVLYELNNECFLGGVRLSKYSDGWRINDLVSFYAETPTLGSVEKIEESQYEAMVGKW